METLFYFPDQAMSLDDVLAVLQKAGLVDMVVRPHTDRLILQQGTWAMSLQTLSNPQELLEPEQLEVLQEVYLGRGIVLSFPLAKIEEIVVRLRVLLARFGGWVGLDDGTFHDRFDQNRLDPLASAFLASCAT